LGHCKKGGGAKPNEKSLLGTPRLVSRRLSKGNQRERTEGETNKRLCRLSSRLKNMTELSSPRKRGTLRTEVDNVGGTELKGGEQAGLNATRNEAQTSLGEKMRNQTDKKS